MYKLQFPKKYENTNLGTVVCYETRAVVNGEDIYWYDIDGLIKRGSKVLIYNHEVEGYPEWITAECKSCSTGFPILLDDNALFPGINCEIVGVKGQVLWEEQSMSK